MRHWRISIAAIVIAIVLWDLAVRFSDNSLIPGPLAVMRVLGELAVSSRLARYAIASLFRVTWGFALAVIVGVPIGLVLGWFSRGGRTVGPILQFERPISPLA